MPLGTKNPDWRNQASSTVTLLSHEQLIEPISKYAIKNAYSQVTSCTETESFSELSFNSNSFSRVISERTNLLLTLLPMEPIQSQ